MTQFTVTMWCEHCQRFTPHRVYYLDLWGNPPEMYVHFGHHCLKVKAVTGKGKNRKTLLCNKFRRDVIHVRSWNCLVQFAKEEYPADFTTGADDETS